MEEKAEQELEQCASRQAGATKEKAAQVAVMLHTRLSVQMRGQLLFKADHVGMILPARIQSQNDALPGRIKPLRFFYDQVAHGFVLR